MDHSSDPHITGDTHVSPPWLLITTFLALIGLTILTVGSSYFPLGHWDLFVAMTVATMKALLVAVYFMHLRHDKPLNTVFILLSLAFVAMFIGPSLVDSMQYQPEVEAAELP